jgi:hypothetical protein
MDEQEPVLAAGSTAVSERTVGVAAVFDPQHHHFAR